MEGCYENQIEQDGKPVTVCVHPGEALFAPPNCWNIPTWRLSVELLSVFFGEKELGISIIEAQGPDSPRIKTLVFCMARPIAGPIPQIMEAMLEVQAKHKVQAVLPELSHALLYCLRQLICETVSRDTTGRGQRLLERARKFLQVNYQNDVTRDSVADELGVSPNYLSRLFQVHESMTFSDYLAHVRVDRGKCLLRNDALKLQDIASCCGYRDASYFCLVFKRLMKMTPQEYRDRIHCRLITMEEEDCRGAKKT